MFETLWPWFKYLFINNLGDFMEMTSRFSQNFSVLGYLQSYSGGSSQVDLDILEQNLYKMVCVLTTITPFLSWQSYDRNMRPVFECIKNSHCYVCNSGRHKTQAPESWGFQDSSQLKSVRTDRSPKSWRNPRTHCLQWLCFWALKKSASGIINGIISNYLCA